MSDIKIIGDKVLIAKIDKLISMGANRSAIRGIFNRASKPLRMAARSNAKRNKVTGTLWRAIKMINSRRNRSLFWIGPARGRKQTYDAWYAYFIEAGTQVRGLRSGKLTGKIRPSRFMAKAYFSTKGTVKINIGKELNKLIIKLTHA